MCIDTIFMYVHSCKTSSVNMEYKCTLGGRTIKDLLGKPKDRDTICQESEVIYRYKCGRGGLWRRTYWGVRKNIHTKIQRTHESPTTNPWPSQHHWSWYIYWQLQQCGREDQNLARSIKEPIFIRINDSPSNRNIGKYQLQHIWDEVLMISSEIRLK